MRRSIIGLCLLFHFYANTQITFNHQYKFDNFPFQVLTSVLPVSDGYFATGVMTDTSSQDNAIGNIFVKFNLLGEIEFMKKLSDPTKYYQTWWGDLQFAPDGNLLDIGIASDTTTDIILIKYSPDGDTNFTKEIPNPLAPYPIFTYAAELVVGTDGYLYLLGRVDAEELNNAKDIYLFKLDQGGNLITSYSYGVGINDIPLSLLSMPGKGFVIGSRQTNWGQVSQNYTSSINVFLIDSTGNVQSKYTSPDTQLFDAAKDMAPTPDGGLVIATGVGIEHQVNSEWSWIHWNSYLLKLDSNYQKEWGIEMKGTRPSPETGFIKVVKAMDESGYITTGNLGEDISVGEEVYGSWVVKVAPEGDSLWARYYSYFDGIDAQTRPKDLKATSDGGYIIVGETKPKYPDGQQQRAWIMKLDEHGCLIPGCEEGDTVISSIHQQVERPVRLAIHPNPASDYLNFQLRTQRAMQTAHFRIVDSNGRVVKELESNLPTSTHIVPVDGWAQGIYFLQWLEDGRVRHTERFVVAR